MLLHEIGHAFELKHSFEGSTCRAPGIKNHSNTVMSHTATGYAGYVLSRYIFGNAAANRALGAGPGLGKPKAIAGTFSGFLMLTVLTNGAR